MAAYYNEIEPFAADWIRNLIARGLIAPGDVDTRSIIDVRPDDLRGYTQCHFFAGIGGWSYALRSAGWDDTRPVWTGSCPCQPFSLAGKQKGFDDARHLWPVWRELIRECDPAVVFGEQVASATEWLGLVRSDLEAMGRAVGQCLSKPRARVRTISVIDTGLWPTARANDSTGDKIPPGRTGGLALKQMVWPTPTASADKSIRTPAGALAEIERGKSPDLAALAMWQTPVADDAVDRVKGKVNSRGEPKLSGQAIQATWPTASVTNAHGNGYQNSKNGITPTLSGVTGAASFPGSSAPTEKRGALNPDFVCWLMGYPAEWVSCADSETRSIPARPRRSSKPLTTP